MANLTGGSFKRISPEDIKVRKSSLNQLVDVIQEDVSGSATRRSYQVFVTGGIGPGVTSSLFHTVYDQDFTLQTSNPIFDITFGLFAGGTTVTNARTATDSAGKLLFQSESLMMREKVDIYKQYASTLLGDADSAFFAPFDSTTTSTTSAAANDRIEEALFISFKRLFARDKIKRETFAVRLNRTGSVSGHTISGSATGQTQLQNSLPASTFTGSNIAATSEIGNAIFTDLGAASNQRVTFGGSVGQVVNSANTSETVGLIFYDHGTVVLDMAKTFMGDQHMSGVISGMRGGTMSTNTDIAAGKVLMGGGNMTTTNFVAPNPNATFIPDFLVSGSVDDVLKHVCSTRFQSGTFTAMTFQNVTSINSTLVFCRATADEFNYSTNPSFTNTEGRMRVVDVGQEDTQRTFTFPTTVGLHDEFGNLLAVAKMSRPIEKNDEKDVTFRVRLDF